jgi:hypothetical protein
VQDKGQVFCGRQRISTFFSTLAGKWTHSRSIRKILIALGHKSSKITEAYTHITKKSWNKIKSPIDYLHIKKRVLYLAQQNKRTVVCLRCKRCRKGWRYGLIMPGGYKRLLAI